jgi:hypothetical protein
VGINTAWEITMRNKAKLLTDLQDASKLIDDSKDERSFFTHLKRYLDLLHQDEDVLSCVALEAEKEKSSIHPNDVEARKHTSFWMPWDELDALWQLDNFGYQDAENLYAKNTKQRDGHEVVSLTDEAGMLLAKYELDEAHSGNSSYLEAGFSMQEYRLYFEVVSAKVKYLLSDALPAQIATVGLFELKEDGGIYYDGKIVNLKPQLQRLAQSLIKANGILVRREVIIDALWPEGSKFLDNPKSEPVINKRIATRVSELNTKLRKRPNYTPIISTGSTSYKLVP